MADEQAEKDFAALQAKMLENNGKMKAVRDKGWRAAAGFAPKGQRRRMDASMGRSCACTPAETGNPSASHGGRNVDRSGERTNGADA
jgi:hypothetical protein